MTIAPFAKKPKLSPMLLPATYYLQLLCLNPKLLHVLINAQVLALIAWSRYICIKKKTHHHHLLCKCHLWTLMSHGTYKHVEMP